MPRSFSPDIDPTAIGSVSQAPFAKLPDPTTLFATRAERLLFLAGHCDLAPYLRFLAGIATAQHAVAQELPPVAEIPVDRLDRSREHAMPPLDRAGFRRDATLDTTFARLFAVLDGNEMPTAAREALDRLRALEADQLDIVVGNVMADAVPVDSVAEHVFAAAALQVHFARLASELSAERLRPIGDTLCPSCGGPPVASTVVGWPGAENTRFCSCPLCATMWNYVRVRCTACGSTKGVGYQAIEGAPDTAKAETCDECGSYAKVFYQVRDPAMEPVADDVATLSLDLLMREGRYRRSGYNPYLIGY